MNSSLPMCTKCGYKHRYAISLLLAFLAISHFPHMLKHETNMVASYHIVMLLCLDSYEQCFTQLLNVLHKFCNTDVLGFQWYIPTLLLTLCFLESCIYIWYKSHIIWMVHTCDTQVTHVWHVWSKPNIHDFLG